MKKETLSVKIAALVIALSIVTGFAAGSVTFAQLHDTEEATVSISAASDWENGDTGGDSDSLSIMGFNTTPDPIPESNGVFTIRAGLSGNSSGTVSAAELKVGSNNSVIHAKKIIDKGNSANNTRKVHAKFRSYLLDMYKPGVDSHDAELTLTFENGATVTASGKIRLKGTGKPESTGTLDSDTNENDSSEVAENDTIGDGTDGNETDSAVNETELEDNETTELNGTVEDGSVNETTENETETEVESNETVEDDRTGSDDSLNETEEDGSTTDDLNGTDEEGRTDTSGELNETDEESTGSEKTLNETDDGTDSEGELNETDSDDTNSTNETTTNETANAIHPIEPVVVSSADWESEFQKQFSRPEAAEPKIQVADVVTNQLTTPTFG